MRNLAGDARQFLAIAEPSSGIVTAEWNELPVCGHILDDASAETPQIVTVRVHKVHASYEDAVEAALGPSFGSAFMLVFP
jgi:hypothetical protein